MPLVLAPLLELVQVCLLFLTCSPPPCLFLGFCRGAGGGGLMELTLHFGSDLVGIGLWAFGLQFLAILFETFGIMSFPSVFGVFGYAERFLAFSELTTTTYM
ncbi:hypothetical protein DFP73DRAFT_544444 [Morchella snyderi]|nr:hypothetical protein DFP73DRAFT_544444 [Morchella snyderi]